MMRELRIQPFREEHLRCFPEEQFIPGMAGVTMTSGDEIVFCGGVVDCDWGTELWIAVSESASPGQRLRVGRLARAYVDVLLETCDELWTSTLTDQERWMQWIGFRYVETIGSDAGDIKRWVLRKEDDNGDRSNSLSHRAGGGSYCSSGGSRNRCEPGRSR